MLSASERPDIGSVLNPSSPVQLQGRGCATPPLERPGPIRKQRLGSSLMARFSSRTEEQPRGTLMTMTAQLGSNGEIGKRLLNVREAALYLGLQVDTVYKKARLREIPAVKVGRALRFDVVALNRYVEQHTIQIL